MKNFTNDELSTITNALQGALDFVREQGDHHRAGLPTCWSCSFPATGTACSPWESGTAHRTWSPRSSSG